jgi:hypothetical protein
VLFTRVTSHESVDGLGLFLFNNPSISSPHTNTRKKCTTTPQEYIARKLIQWGKVKEFKQSLADNRKKPNAYFGYAVSIPIPVSECVVFAVLDACSAFAVLCCAVLACLLGGPSLACLPACLHGWLVDVLID